MTDPARRSRLVGYAALLATVAIWGVWIVLTHQAVTHSLSPAAIALLRMIAPTILLAPAIWRAGIFDLAAREDARVPDRWREQDRRGDHAQQRNRRGRQRMRHGLMREHDPHTPDRDSGEKRRVADEARTPGGIGHPCSLADAAERSTRFRAAMKFTRSFSGSVSRKSRNWRRRSARRRFPQAIRSASRFSRPPRRRLRPSSAAATPGPSSRARRTSPPARARRRGNSRWTRSPHGRPAKKKRRRRPPRWPRPAWRPASPCRRRIARARRA